MSSNSEHQHIRVLSNKSQGFVDEVTTGPEQRSKGTGTHICGVACGQTKLNKAKRGKVAFWRVSTNNHYISSAISGCSVHTLHLSVQSCYRIQHLIIYVTPGNGALSTVSSKQFLALYRTYTHRTDVDSLVDFTFLFACSLQVMSMVLGGWHNIINNYYTILLHDNFT